MSQRPNPAWTLLFVVPVSLCFGAWAAGQRPGSGPTFPSTSHYVKVWTQALHRKDMEDARPMNQHIQELVLAHLDDYLAHRLPLGPQGEPQVIPMRREIESVFGELRPPYLVQVENFVRPWKNAQLIGAAYSLSWTEQYRYNVVALYLREGQTTRRVGVTNFVDGYNLDFTFLLVHLKGLGGHATRPEVLWILINGTRLGKSHPRLALALYSFDGRELKPLWELKDVYDGKFRLLGEGEQLIITSLKEDEYVRESQQRRRPPRHETVYRRTDSGYEFESTREIPF